MWTAIDRCVLRSWIKLQLKLSFALAKIGNVENKTKGKGIYFMKKHYFCKKQLQKNICGKEIIEKEDE